MWSDEGKKMAVDIKKLIAAINPDVFCSDERDEAGKKLSSKVKQIAKEEGLIKAAEVAKLKEADFLDIVQIKSSKNAFSLTGIKSPIEQHKLVYDAFSQNLEPIYFWILDYVNNNFGGGTEKLIDNFVSSPQSGQFGEMSRRAAILRDDASKQMATVNQILKSILNLIYDLKEFKLRLVYYEELKSDDKMKRESAMLSLKQIWMDNVDIKRQAGSINGLAQQLDFVTIRDAFMAADSLEAVDKLDLNDRVKRILKQRVPEFFRWVKESERELKKRFEIEKTYLKSQVNSVKLYARWVKPALVAARQLEQNLEPTADIVNAFNTSLFRLVLMAKGGSYDPADDVLSGDLPKVFKKMKFRKYTPFTIIEFGFRSAPDRADQRGGYGYRGKAEVVFTSFAMNEDELKLLKKKVEEDDFGDVYKMITGATEESLGQLQGDIEELLGEKDPNKEEGKKKGEDANPFSALFSFFKKEEKKKSGDLEKDGIPKDTEYEKVLRSQALLGSRWTCRKLYDDYKKVHGMPAFPPTMG